MDADAEKNLIARCKKGVGAAYTDLIQAHSSRVFAICLALLGNRDDAEDATQQTLLKGFTQIRALRNADRFAPWIGRIARNLCLDEIRKRTHRHAPPMPCHEPDPTQADDLRRLEAALARLGEEYRVPLLLFYFDGRSTRSIAEMLGVSRANVQTRLSRARKQLRQLLAGKGDDE